jgi:hypothetical protein
MKIALNWLLFATESLGALIILWFGVPIYRRLFMGVTNEQAGASVFFWASIGVTVIQVSYWIRLRCFPPPRFSRQLVLGSRDSVFGASELCIHWRNVWCRVLHSVSTTGVFHLESVSAARRALFDVLLRAGSGPIR